MRLERLFIENFKGFIRREFVFHPQFNLVVGENGTGKTSVLEALSIAAASWFLGLRGFDSRHIRVADVRMVGSGSSAGMSWEPQYPCIVEARGVVQKAPLEWRRTLNSPQGRTTSVGARALKDLAIQTDAAVRKGERITLPLISYYGTGRLWDFPREAQASGAVPVRREDRSRFQGYYTSVDPRLSVSELVKWIATQSWSEYQEGRPSPPFVAVREALTRCVQGAKRVFFDAKLGELVVDFGDSCLKSFNNLSDGQRSMLAMVGDIAQKAVTLNPHLEDRALAETPGVVLVDELDLHLHPKWQRHIIEDLRTTFPEIQFICSTHSPFLIQSLRGSEELLMLEGQPVAELGNKSVEQIASEIQGISNPGTSSRYEEMKTVARHYLETLDAAARAPEAQLAEYKARLAQSIAPYADNPAFQAFLELKRAAALGA